MTGTYTKGIPFGEEINSIGGGLVLVISLSLTRGAALLRRNNQTGTHFYVPSYTCAIIR